MTRTTAGPPDTNGGVTATIGLDTGQPNPIPNVIITQAPCPRAGTGPTRSAGFGDAPAEDGPEGNGRHRMAPPRPGEEHGHRADGDRGHADDDGRPAAEEPECDPGVLDVVDRERPDDVDAVAERQRASDELLRELIGEDGRARDDDEHEPLRASGSEKPLGRGDRLERVRRRADADVDLRDITRRGLAHELPSSARWSSMQSVA